MEQHIVLVGVGHVFDIAEHVTAIVDAVSPDVVAVELDKRRLQALLHSEQGSLQRQPVFYRILATMQRRIAAKYGVSTGSEMKAAVLAARAHTIGVLCIDMDIQYVLRQLWRQMSLKQKIYLVLGGVFSLKLKKEQVEQEVQSFEEHPNTYIDQVRRHFPEIGALLIDKRNEFMATQLMQSLELYDIILAFVGEGHIMGLTALLENETTLTTIHLSDVRKGTWRQCLGK
jgi:pheromone shutdown protein TraB